MTTKEFSDEFDSMLRSYMIKSNFGTGQSIYEFDEYEKSLLLTQAQLDIVLELYKNYEEDEYTRLQLAPLLSTEVLCVLNAAQVVDDSADFKDVRFENTVYYTLAKNLLSRYKDYISYIVDSNLSTNSYLHNIIGIVEGKALIKDVNNKCNGAPINKWVKNAVNFQEGASEIKDKIVINTILTGYDNVYPSRKADDDMFKILPVTSVRLNEINSILRNPFRGTKNKVYMCYSPYVEFPSDDKYFSYERLIYLTYADMIYTHDVPDPQSANTIQKAKNLDTSSFTPTKTICDFGLEFITPFELVMVLLTVLRTPEPIVLQDFDDLSIDGINKAQTCKLQNSLHRTILKRAVELAIKKIPSSNV